MGEVGTPLWMLKSSLAQIQASQSHTTLTPQSHPSFSSPHVSHRQPSSPPKVQKVHSSFTVTTSSTLCCCVECLVVAFHRRSSSRASMEENTH
ncbi:hypothetical protein PIB30_041355 [Stylosanthes scabra]|uniref:Uncharacterized protein n=1 Tax=Stylosanthes scabra TaxID=79078 RepID=A0ABU6YHB5_9FABA|nr:hypothetical protein [Stylosanthes scabra]